MNNQGVRWIVGACIAMAMGMSTSVVMAAEPTGAAPAVAEHGKPVVKKHHAKKAHAKKHVANKHHAKKHVAKKHVAKKKHHAKKHVAKKAHAKQEPLKKAG